MSETPDIVVDIKKSEIQEVIKWKIYYDTKTKKPIGTLVKGVSGVIAVGMDEVLPQFTNKPHWVEVREAIMIISKKKKN